MDHSVHNKLVSFIWSIADDCLRDVYVRGKYRDVICSGQLKLATVLEFSQYNR
ncbi:type I restriction-modification system subunit M N-terminal domain-containing protein, partial [Vibrio cholerae]|uniref:type I restriction-modification system subunit M N-terminal domain-containing protein n=1 Tax=Vibrio cholerae TaxID=666 RepID=UPI000B1F95D4